MLFGRVELDYAFWKSGVLNGQGNSGIGVLNDVAFSMMISSGRVAFSVSAMLSAFLTVLSGAVSCLFSLDVDWRGCWLVVLYTATRSTAELTGGGG